MCSLIGGYISQKIIKIIGKYDPLNQWLFFDLYDNNYNYTQISNNEILNYRYHDQIFIFGWGELLIKESRFVAIPKNSWKTPKFKYIYF